MDLHMYNTSMYFFLIVSLLTWFLHILYTVQLWFFFTFLALFLNLSKLSILRRNSTLLFLAVYALFVLFQATFVTPTQLLFFLAITGLKKMHNKFLTALTGEGLSLKALKSVALYAPVKLLSSTNSNLHAVQALLKGGLVLIAFIFFNFMI